MKIKPRKRGLLRSWKSIAKRLILHETNIGVTPYGRLRAKVLIFRHESDLHKFWLKYFDSNLGKRCLGVVHGLSMQHELYRKGRLIESHMEVDRRYFCLIGLVREPQKHGRLSAMEYVTHESVHAAFCYEERRRGHFFQDAESNCQESIAYPAGRIARQINNFMAKHDLY